MHITIIFSKFATGKTHKFKRQAKVQNVARSSLYVQLKIIPLRKAILFLTQGIYFFYSVAMSFAA